MYYTYTDIMKEIKFNERILINHRAEISNNGDLIDINEFEEYVKCNGIPYIKNIKIWSIHGSVIRESERYESFMDRWPEVHRHICLINQDILST